MNELSDICDLAKCTGCAACVNVCAHGAIAMREGEDGFMVPRVDAAKCTGCGLCRRACPALRPGAALNAPAETCHAVCADDDLRSESSSGGVFGLFAKEVLSEGGVVYGAAFDGDFKLKHVRATDAAGLRALYKSKYVQSDVGLAYRQCKEDLKSGRPVLFVGTPCQVAGLKMVLDGRPPRNLLTIDLICHGVPSQRSFDRYVDERYGAGALQEIDFRDKRDGWGGPCLVRSKASGKISYRTDSKDAYMNSFFANINLRSSCYLCAYATASRAGDVTIGDFWGVPAEMNDAKGTSVMLVNSRQGDVWASRVLPKSKRHKSYPTKLPVAVQPNLRHPSWKHPMRDEFLGDVDRLPYSRACEANICSPKSVAILNFHWENVNFGALLTAFALNRFLNCNGFRAQNVDYIPSFPWIGEELPNERFDSFRKNHLPMTGRVEAGGDLTFLNEYFANFIVGSDQVWRPEFVKKEKEAFFLGFAEPSKNLISYAASFGADTLECDGDEREEYAARIRCFDHVSVREKSGVEFCREFGLDAKCVVDPVFLLKRDYWESLADEYGGDVGGEIVFYTINEALLPTMRQVAERNFPGVGCRDVTWNTGVQEWLQRIRKCRLLITDSYHGSCFALIFNVPFLCVNTNARTSTRMATLFEALGRRGKIYYSFEDAERDLKAGLVPEDYDQINRRIEDLRGQGAEFLLNALRGPSMDREAKQALRDDVDKTIMDGFRRRWEAVRGDYYRYKILRFVTIGKKRQKYCRKYSAAKKVRRQFKSFVSSKDKKGR